MTGTKPKRKKHQLDFLDSWEPPSACPERETESPEVLLWAVAIELAIRDATRRKNRFAVCWINSNAFLELCGLLSFSMETVQRIRGVVNRDTAALRPAPAPLQAPERPWMPLPLTPAPAAPPEASGPAPVPDLVNGWTTNLDWVPLARKKRRLSNVSL